MTPVVSVIIPSFNHERFIKQCIQSVLDQTFQDFEIVITDDGSSDRTAEIVEEFSDSRIKFFRFPVNKGASAASNNCILNSSGKYIAMLSSDDIWLPEKLKVQVEYLESHPDICAVFGKVKWMDESGNLLAVGFPYKNIFNVNNKTRFEWLRYFFTEGNCLCHPSSLIRRDHYFDVGLLEPAFASLPDFDLWIRLCLKFDIHILDQPLIYFRRINESSNASGDNVNSRIRNRFEYKQSLDHYLRIRDPKELLLIFPEAAKYGKVSAEIIPYFLGRIAINSGIDFMMLWGLESIYMLFKNDTTAQELKKNCGFTHRDFIRLTGECDVYKLSITPIQAIFPVQVTQDTGQMALLKLSFRKYSKDLVSVLRAFVSVTKGFLRTLIQTIWTVKNRY